MKKLETKISGAVLGWYAKHGRNLPWRRTADAWQILVSELMLQQTQVDRVIPKFNAFVKRWPTPAALSRASLAEVLAAWSGLGYNRRARHLRDAAIVITHDRGSAMPRNVEGLLSLPGVGPYTSRAVASFAYNADVALWDTNVRRIFFRIFFGGEFSKRDPSPEAFQKLLDAALPHGRSRDWHNALMDFGSLVCLNRAPKCAVCPLQKLCRAAPHFLKGNVAPRSLVKKQSKFEGSRRQARGAVLRLLAAAGKNGLTRSSVVKKLARADAEEVLAKLEEEGLIVRRRMWVSLPH